MKILAIDPGNEYSAFVLMAENYEVESRTIFSPENSRIAGKFPNALLLKNVKEFGKKYGDDMTVVLEMVASYGMAVGKEVFETCVWIGRFQQAATDCGCHVEFIYRIEEKQYICHDSRAKDTNIRQALIDRFARFDKKTGKGQKNHPDVFYKFKADMWSAFAVGATWLDKQKEGKRAKGS